MVDDLWRSTFNSNSRSPRREFQPAVSSRRQHIRRLYMELRSDQPQSNWARVRREFKVTEGQRKVNGEGHTQQEEKQERPKAQG
jgi:hypothetical protein